MENRLQFIIFFLDPTEKVIVIIILDLDEFKLFVYTHDGRNIDKSCKSDFWVWKSEYFSNAICIQQELIGTNVYAAGPTLSELGYFEQSKSWFKKFIGNCQN